MVLYGLELQRFIAIITSSVIQLCIINGVSSSISGLVFSLVMVVLKVVVVVSTVAGGSRKFGSQKNIKNVESKRETK